MPLTRNATQIAALQSSAGTPLPQRSGLGIRLTEAGELLAGYMRTASSIRDAKSSRK